MKAITTNLLKFAGVAALGCVLFRYALSFSITHGALSGIILSPVLYGGLMFVSGWYLGTKDKRHLPIYDIGFRFHLATYLIHNLISELWFVFGFNAPRETINGTHLIAVIWGIVLFVHFIFYLKAQRNSIAGLKKTDLFE